ncbi:MAG: winged helix-turn-helix transcriptional regulator [Clostridia bacterium]|nr:winged helix-turn-helix transcriptional regulator [Clostridia bacterium]
MKDNQILSLLRKVTAFRKLIFSGVEVELGFELGKTQRGVLMYLAFLGPVPMNDVSEKFALAKGSFTQVADGLEQLGLIERKRCEKDRRIIYLETTEKGKDAAVKIHAATEQRIDSLLSKLPDADKSKFLDSFSAVAEYIDVIRGEI